MPEVKSIHSALRKSWFVRQLLVLSCLIAVSGCAMGGFDMADAVSDSSPDLSIVTGSVNAPDKTDMDSYTLSDQATIKNVVSALNFAQWSGETVPWANPDTGSQGTITTMNERKLDGVLCREFETSRESFSGVSLYKGEACMQSGGIWRMTSFSEV